MRTTLKQVKKIVDDADKARRAAWMQNAVDKAKSLIQQKPDMVTCIELFDAGSNTKILDAALKQFKSLSPKTAAMLFSVDNDNRKAICMAIAPKEIIDKGLKADEWTKAVAEVLGGKSGGKAISAQASGPNIEQIQKAMKVAEEFANSKLQN